LDFDFCDRTIWADHHLYPKSAYYRKYGTLVEISLEPSIHSQNQKVMETQATFCVLHRQ